MYRYCRNEKSSRFSKMVLDPKKMRHFFFDARCCVNTNCRDFLNFYHGYTMNKQSGTERLLLYNWQYVDTNSVRILLHQE